MIQELVLIFIMLASFDAVWLYLTASHTRSVFAEIQKQALTIRIAPAILVYVIMTYAIYWFAVMKSQTAQQAAVNGAGIGIAMYGVYDLTNYATLANYTLQFAITDIVWGTSLCTLTAFLTKWIMN
jgi:uncharacterized membrane protein